MSDDPTRNEARDEDDDGEVRATSEGVYEMLWDCEYCGTKKLLGKTHRHCPDCGAKQNPATRYFPSDEEKIAVKDHVFVGADKSCSFCHAAAGARAKCCPQCGAALAGADEVAKRGDQVHGEGGSFASETAADAKREHAGAAGGAPPAATQGKKKSPLKWILVGAGLLVVLLVVLFSWKKEVTAIVAVHSWEREIRIEKYRAVTETAWCDSMPHDAYRVTRSREIRSQRKVADGEECSTRRVDNGDGTYRQKRECKTKYRDEPVYDERCRFTVDRWRYDRSEGLIGTLTKAPRWPELALRQGTCLGCEREASRDEGYYLELDYAKFSKYHSCKVDPAKWRATPDGSKWTVKVNSLGIIDCSSMKQK